MTTFTQHWQQLQWDYVGMRIHSQTAADVERALAADNPGPEEKQDFVWRLETPDRLARAGIDKIGLGALIGLSDNWRADCFIWWHNTCFI